MHRSYWLSWKNEYIRQSWLFFIDKLLLPTKITSAGIVCSHNSWLASLPQGLFGVLPPGRELLRLLSIKLHLASLWLLTLLTLCCINDVLWVSLKLKQQARNLFSISFQSHSLLAPLFHRYSKLHLRGGVSSVPFSNKCHPEPSCSTSSTARQQSRAAIPSMVSSSMAIWDVFCH